MAAAVSAVIVQTVRFLSFQPPDSESSIVPLGQADSYPRDSLTYVAEARVYVGHDSNGLYALDAVCLHLGCLVEPNRAWAQAAWAVAVSSARTPVSSSVTL